MQELWHVTIFYTGRVQGVGFRYAALQVAKEFEVSGFVTNMVDGRVQLSAQGRRAEVEAFLGQVAERMHGFIRKTEQNDLPWDSSLNGFTIK